MAVLNTGLATPEGYTIGNSVRFNDDNNIKLAFTPDTNGTSTDVFTVAFWCKRSNLCAVTNAQYLWDIDETTIAFNASDNLSGNLRGTESGNYTWATNAVFRDTSAWYHIVAAYDSTQATDTNRFKLYINGVLQVAADFSSISYMPQDREMKDTQTHYIGYEGSGYAFDGYFADYYMIDGQTKAASDFGEFGDYGEWKAKKYAGTYGTNGFFLDFSNSAALGDDAAGSNDWTVTNLAASDQMLDTPTNNFATLNPLGETSDVTYSEGNLKFDNGGSTVWDTALSTMGISSGKWYFEIVQPGSTPDNDLIGFANIQDMNNNLDQHIGNISTGWGIYAGGTPVGIYNSGSSIGTITGSSTWATNDVIMLALDMDNGEAWWGKNDTWWNSGVPASRTNPQVSSITGTIGVGGSCYQSGHNQVWNFGQDSSFAGNKTAQGNTDSNGRGDFYYEPPAGFLALCTANLKAPAVIPSEHFNTVIYTGDGDGSSKTISGVGFQPDFIWIKDRSTALDHNLSDAIRGVTKNIFSNTTGAETTDTESIQSFNADGFTVGNANNINNDHPYVAWNWKANGSGSANTVGDIDSTVSVNTDAGFSIVTYTGNEEASAGADTVGHGLSKAPTFIMFKNRSRVTDWAVYHGSNTAAPETDYLVLNKTDTTTDSDGLWGDTAPTSSVFSVNTYSEVNRPVADDDGYVAYCFHDVEGYSKTGAYTGNALADGTFVYTGFRPAFVMVKPTDNVGQWGMKDIARDTINPATKAMLANQTNTEETNRTMDFLSNGFKWRVTGDDVNNAFDFVWIAFAETPFKYSNAR